MKTHINVLALFAVTSILTACAVDHPGGEPGSATSALAEAPNLADLQSVSRMLSQGGDVALGDGPATAAYAALDRTFASPTKSPLRLRVFSLTLPSDATSVAELRDKELSLGGGKQASLIDEVSRTSGSRELRIHRNSGFESFFDLALHHKDPGGGPLLANDQYVAKARAHGQSAGLFANGPMANPWVYKLGHYVNASSSEFDTAVVRTPYQVHVTFGGSVDGLPIIGSGGHVTMHYTLDGRFIGHRGHVHDRLAPTAAIGQDQIMSPSVALAEVTKRLTSRGVKVDDFVVTRKEFGYLRYGRNSLQRTLAPHYAFFFEPKEGVMSKKLIETICASTDPVVAKLVADDEAAENERKAAMSASVRPTARK